MANYLADLNKFNLSGPPRWWLHKLYDFDNSLVVVPSRQGFYYRLAQRRPLSLAEKITQDALFNESDTKMLASYGLIPVTTILATANWSNPYLFEELRRRAPWRMFDSTDKAIEAVEAQDYKDELDKKIKEDEHLTSLGKDSWGLYNKKIGLRTHMWSPKTSNKSQATKLDRSASIKIVS
jgi:hypothetical protein